MEDWINKKPPYCKKRIFTALVIFAIGMTLCLLLIYAFHSSSSINPDDYMWLAYLELLLGTLAAIHSYFSTSSVKDNASRPKALFENFFKFSGKLIQLPFRLVWDLIVIALAVGLTIVWVGFVFGSILIGILLLLFAPGLLLFPLGLLVFLVKPWPEE